MVHFGRTIVDGKGLRRISDVRLTGTDRKGRLTGTARVDGQEIRVTRHGHEWETQRFRSKRLLRY